LATLREIFRLFPATRPWIWGIRSDRENDKTNSRLARLINRGIQQKTSGVEDRLYGTLHHEKLNFTIEKNENNFD
jgi:hypothetical protein